MKKNEIEDKYGRVIEPYDILKVFHFIGARGKKHYIYKRVMEYAKDTDYLIIEHLSSEGWYSPNKDMSPNIEIVQSKHWRKLDHKRKEPTK